MRPLSTNDLVRIWELAQAQPPLERALTILAVGLPEMTRGELAELSLGQRDSSLLSLREQTLGPELEGHANCPQCEAGLQFTLRTEDLRLRATPQPEELVLTVEEFTVWFRLPTSRDLAAVTGGDPATRGRRLAERCVVHAERGGAHMAPEELPEAVIERLAESIAQNDPQAEMLVNLVCLACGHRWQTPLDLASYFWTEIRALVRRTLYEVHALARAHGWSEGEILAMSAARRQAYLEMLDNG